MFRYPDLNKGDEFIPFTNRETLFFMRGADGKVARYTGALALHTARPQTFLEKRTTQLWLAGIGLLALTGLAAFFWRLPKENASKLARRVVVATAVVAPATLGLCLCVFLFKWIGFGSTTGQTPAASSACFAASP